MYVHLVYDITVVFEDLPDVNAGCLHLAAGAYGTPFVLCSTEKVIKRHTEGWGGKVIEISRWRFPL